MPTLRIRDAGGEERRFAWREGSVGIGRDPSNHVVLAAGEAARWHAALFAEEAGRYRLRDLGSRTGVRVGGRRVWSHALAEGDCIEIAGALVSFSSTEEGAPGSAPVVLLEDEGGPRRPALTPLEPGLAAVAGEREAPERRAGSMRRLLEALRAVGGRLDPEELLGELLAQIEAVAAPSRSFAALVREDGSLDVRACRSPQPVPVSRTVLRACLESGRLLLATDLGAAPDLDSESARDLEIRSAACLPLHAEGRVRGLVYADWRRGLRPTEGVLEWVAALALYASSAFSGSLRHRDLRRERDRLARDQGLAGEIVGLSAAARELADVADRCAAVDVDVLLTGETGTGKELLARRIHGRSSRRDGPFVAVNCAAIPAELFESELFGHARGAFTGAGADRAGRFQEAHGGTLFLDEIGELALHHQAKLLRVLEERRVTPVGGRPRAVDLRVVAATNRDLDREVGEGRLRADLRQRLGVPVATRPLRERPEDLPMLAYYHLDGLGSALGRTPRRIASEVMDAFRRYPWPGNVRELRNCLRNALLFCGEEVRAADLRLNPEVAGRDGRALPSLEAVEREHFERVLRATRGNQAQAAQILGLSENTVRARMEKYGLERRAFRD